MAEEPPRMTRAGAVARWPPRACPKDGCNCNNRGSTKMGEGHRCATTFAAQQHERAGSSLSSLSRSPASAANSAQFGIGEIHVIMGSDSDSGSSSADGEGVISDNPSSSSSDFAIGMAEGIDRPGNPRPSLSQTSSLDKLSNEAPPGSRSSASSSLSLVQRLLGRRRRFPSSVYLPTPICNNTSNDGRRVTISEREVGEALQMEVESLQQKLENIDDALASLEAKTKAGRRELLHALAGCGGDAKDVSLVAAVEELGNLRSERIGLVRERDGVAGGLAWRLNKLDEICMRSPLPLPRMPRPANAPGAPGTAGPDAMLEGNWFTLTKPTYLDCLGCNSDGNPMYTLGRMSFEMFRPGKLVVSIEAVFNPITEVVQENGEGEVLAVPKALREEVALLLDGNRSGGARGGRRPALRTYHIVTAFVIEPYSPSFGTDSPNIMVQTPIRGIVTTYGYALPDPAHTDRLSVWFTGGKVECGEPRNSPEFQAWKRLFRGEEGVWSPNPALRQKRRRSPRRTFREGVMVAAANMLMGARGYDDGMDEETGEMSYSFSRPLGGHGKAYVDIVHLDEQTRVMRGHAGTIYVFTRLSK